MSTGRHKQERGVGLQPLDEINGYQVRPGFYNRDGATATTRGVSFTIHSFGATACYLLLFRPQEKEPYVTLKYPEAYHIGNTYSMFVFGLKMRSSWTDLMMRRRDYYLRKKMFCLIRMRGQ